MKKTRKQITTSIRKAPIVLSTPIKKKEQRSFGKLTGTAQVLKDIVLPIDEPWNVDSNSS